MRAMTPASGQAAARPYAALPARTPGPADAPARDYRDSPWQPRQRRPRSRARRRPPSPPPHPRHPRPLAPGPPHRRRPNHRLRTHQQRPERRMNVTNQDVSQKCGIRSWTVMPEGEMRGTLAALGLDTRTPNVARIYDFLLGGCFL